MEFLHTCAFCGWSRDSDAPVLLPAGCPDCGCRVDSLTRGEAQRRAFAADDSALPATLRVPRALRAALVALALLFIVAAARVGFDLLAVEGATIAVGAAGFLLLPFVPQRVGAAAAAAPPR